MAKVAKRTVSKAEAKTAAPAAPVDVVPTEPVVEAPEVKSPEMPAFMKKRKSAPKASAAEEPAPKKAAAKAPARKKAAAAAAPVTPPTRPRSTRVPGSSPVFDLSKVKFSGGAKAALALASCGEQCLNLKGFN